MKMLKIFGITILFLFMIAAGLLIVSTLHHVIQVEKETKIYPAPGRMVEVNDKLLHVYQEGQGKQTLVFMAGHGTINPALDFKPLWMKLVDDFRIVVVEKSGYGWSEPSKSPRDLDTMLEETRKALDAAGESPPYVLIPHSMSGLEAVYWAQKYPGEVKAVIGLDPLTPEVVEILPEPNLVQMYAMALISRTGISRTMPDADVEKNFPLLKSDALTEEEKQSYLAVFYRSGYSNAVLREVHALHGNARRAAANEFPQQIPMYFFISTEKEADVPGWKDTLVDDLVKIQHGKYLVLDADHYLHYEQSAVIAEEARAFLEELK